MQTPHKPDSAPEPPIREVRIVTGDAFFLQIKPHEPDIPAGKGRPCPQCNKVAWAASRWCWHCQFDFDRAAMPRFHPTKVCACALVAIVSSAITAAVLRLSG